MSVATAIEDQDANKKILDEAIRLGKEGMFLDAFKQLKTCGPIRGWTGAARAEVAWIVSELGAPRLSRWHILKAYREAPQSLAVRNAYGAAISEENGPLDALEFVEGSSQPKGDEKAEEQLRWLWLEASSLTQLRDFAAAERLLEKMESIGERPEMTLFSRAYWLERQDRYDDALDAITRALEIRAARSTIAYRAHLLTLVGRDDEAHELLQEYDGKKQIASLSWQMSAISYERRDYPQCARLLERFESLSPLLERAFGERFTMFRCELARRNGNDEKAIQYARRSKSAYGKKIAERLADPSRADRVDKILGVEFVRQHEMTCGPATLSAISRYWGRHAEHLEVAEEICYNGTTAHAERKWAEENGYTTREFTVTEEVTEALIGRDIPFTLVTRGAGYAHLQAVIGYDGRTGTILIRDPFHRVRGAAAADELLESQASHGPRGMLLVPSDRSELIDGVELPDAELYDMLHEMDGALIRHDRDAAMNVHHAIEKKAPEHRLYWQAQRQLAIYDGNEQGILKAVKQLCKTYPDDESLQMSELSLLGNLGRSEERIQRLRELVAKPIPHPLLKLQLAESLALDGRYRDEAYTLLREAIRKGSSYARSYLELGDLYWQRYDRDAALRQYRFAACLDDKDEYLATRYFDASVAMGGIEEALNWLRARFDRFGAQSMQPGLTLHHALSRLRRHAESIEVLESAMKLRSDDAELTIAAVHSFAAISSEYWPRAEELLEAVRAKAPQRQWHEAASEMAVLRGEWKQALELLEHLLPRTPLSMQLREKITELITQIDGEDAAIEHWRAASETFPHYQPLAERYAMSLRGRPLEEIQPVLEGILEQDPENAWAVRELAQHFLYAGKLYEAENMVSRAVELDGENVFAIGLQATLDSRRGDNQAARERLRKLIEKDVSEEYIVSKFLDYCDGVEEQKRELAWLLSELRRQPVTGEVLMTYREYALSVVPEDELLDSLREAAESRPDLWQAHQAWIRQLTHMQRLDEAIEAVEKATALFPLEPNAWFEKYRIAQAIGDATTQRTALERCQLLRPTNPAIIRALSDVLCSEGSFQEARELLDQLVSQQPLDAVNRGYLADVLAELDESEAALEQYEQAVSLEPEYDYAWGRLDSMASQLERPDHRLEVGRRLTEEKPHVAGAWLEYARSLGFEERFDEGHAALDRAEAIDPYREAIHISRARLMLNSGDFAGAMKALQPPIFPVVPASLQATRAQMLWDVGHQDEAYELIHKTAIENPGHLAIWSRLEQWAMIRGDKAQAIMAVEHQVQTQPHDPDVLDAAGNTFAAIGEDAKAIEVFRRTIEIAPGYAGSRCSLFDLLVDQDQWEEAARIMRDLPRCDQHPTVIARRMKVSMHEGNHEQAEKDFEAILSSDQWSTWAVEQGVDMMVEAGKKQDVVRRVEDALNDKDANPEFGRTWASLQLSEPGRLRPKLDRIADRIRQLLAGEKPRAAHSAMSALMPQFSQDGMGPELKRFVKRNEEWIRGDTHCWTLIAFAYADRPSAVTKSQIRRWIENWRDRDDYAPWMFTNIHELCRIVGDEAGGREAIQIALSMPSDHMQSQLRLWAALDALFQGDHQLALQHFMGASRLENLEGLDRVLHHWVESVIHALQSHDKQAAFKQIREQLASTGLKPAFYATQPVYRLPYVRTLRLIADAIGTPKAKLWALAKIARVQLTRIGLT